MVSSIDTSALRDKVKDLAYELADAHATMKRQQQGTESGQAVFRAKNMAYGLLREIEAHELKELFARPARRIVTDNSCIFVNLEPRPRQRRVSIIRRLRAIFSR
jgi:hypothetical protein